MKFRTLARNRFASRAAFIGGLLHVIVPLAILVLPLLGECIGANCVWRPYSSIGNTVGYLTLALMILLGGIAIGTTQSKTLGQSLKRWSLGFIVVVSLGVVYLTGWSIGISFLPGTVLLLYATVFI